MNSHGMFLCQSEKLDEAGAMLTDAYHQLESDQTIQDQQMLDLLKATTLNNLGVVECHKGLHREALNHLEVAQSLEQQWHIQSPSIYLNLCATYNALGQHDKATTAALETIALLREMARAQRQSGPGQDQKESSLAAAGGNPLLRTTNEENQVLWGAAWHNLGVAQINTALLSKKADLSEHTNVLVIFQNAIKATTELLGGDHSMTKAVLQTYRAVRSFLRDKGVFKQHTALLTCGIPPLQSTSSSSSGPQEAEPGLTVRSTIRKHQRDIRVTIRADKKNSNGSPSNGSSGGGGGGGYSSSSKLVQLQDREAYPQGAPGLASRIPNPVGPVSPRRHHNELRGLPVSGLLLHAATLYSNPHPLLLHGSARDHQINNTIPWEPSPLLSGAIMNMQQPPASPREQLEGTASSGRRRWSPSQQQGGSSRGGRRKQSARAGGAPTGNLIGLTQSGHSAGYLPPIEVSPRRSYKQQQQQGNSKQGSLRGIADPQAYHPRDAQEVLNNSDIAMWVEAADTSSPLRPHATRAVRPAYAQQIYVVDDNDRVAQPTTHAHVDYSSSQPSAVRHQSSTSNAMIAPRPPGEKRGTQQQQQQDGDHYPNLHLLVQLAH